MPTIKKSVSVVLLGITWLVLFYYITVTTSWTFAPWDMIDPMPDSVRGWELSLNRFFEVGFGQYMFSTCTIIISVIAWWRNTIYQKNKTLILAGSNILFIVGLFIAGSFAGHINSILFPFDSVPAENYVELIGYHRVIVPAIIEGLITLCWIYFQVQITQDRRKAKQKHHDKLTQVALDSQQASQRLQDDRLENRLVYPEQAMQSQQLR
ncbi:MAG: hypothetical protein ACFE0Q_18275 [Anaerolineae bacterium]